MWRIACGILAKAAVLLLGLAGTQRRIRLTATVALLDVALLPHELVPQHVDRADQEVVEAVSGRMQETPTPAILPQVSFDWFTLLGIVDFTHLLDVGVLWLSLYRRASRHPPLTGLNEPGKLPAFGRIEL